MVPYEQPSIFDKLQFMFTVPKVVINQRAKFESDELLKKCSRESEVKYTGFQDRPRDERVYRFQAGLREGHTELVRTQLFSFSSSRDYQTNCHGSS
ncbi:protein big brother-like [Tropilaelaps mercedesae]|uniref:Protein big brother-like n=1 Tax=Tropilaelaps mercedesae TaxID=418985 RepID=A0A1V9X1Q0_9ACAR|nr:protein big brother-like [Tropilaelaps mercedesae]